MDPLNSQPFFVLGSTSVSVVEGSDNSVALIGGVTLTDADDVRASAVISVIAPQEGDVLSVSDSQALGVSIATDGLSATVAITEFASLVDALQAISYASAANFTTHSVVTFPCQYSTPAVGGSYRKATHHQRWRSWSTSHR